MHCKTLIVLVGGPCSGKSSAGKIAAEHLIAKYISSGDIAREMARHDSDIQDSLNNGNLAPEAQMRKSISTKLWEHFMVRDENIVILDGFPRYGEQAEWLRHELPTTIQIKYVLFHAPSWILKRRANNRGRSDDGSFERRLGYYRDITYKELRDYIDTTIYTAIASAEICAMLLVDFVKEVIKC